MSETKANSPQSLSLQHCQRPRAGEAGYLLLGAVVMVALVLIALAVAAPVIARSIRRDKEVESEHRAEQYMRAIRMYQRACKCQAYPPTMDALEKGTTVRYLRQRYIDPLTGKSDWKLIHTPQTKIHIFFGETFDDLPAGSLGSASNLASTNGPVGIGATGAPPPGIGAAGGTGGSGATGATGASGATGGSSSDAGMFGDSNGGPIKGVSTSRSGDSILNPNGQTTYDTWEFWWDPRMELLYAKSNILGGGGIGSASATGLGNNISGASGSTGTGTGTGVGTGGGTGTVGSTGPTSPLGSGFGPR